MPWECLLDFVAVATSWQPPAGWTHDVWLGAAKPSILVRVQRHDWKTRPGGIVFVEFGANSEHSRPDRARMHRALDQLIAEAEPGYIPPVGTQRFLNPGPESVN